MTRKALLVTIGAGGLPNTTPPTFAPASWFPVVYTPPPPAVPGNFVTTGITDAVLLTWTESPGADQYEVERAPGPSGPWSLLGRTSDLRYTSIEPQGTSAWFRVRAESRGRFSEYTAPTIGVPTVGNFSTRVLDIVIGAASRAWLWENGTTAMLSESGKVWVSEGGVAGQAVVDCRYSKFRISLTENITSLVFVNVSDSHELVIEVTQRGAFNIAWPASVVPVSGVPYVPTQVVGAVDVIRLITFDRGRTWRLIVDRGEGNPDAGGAVFAVSLSPSPASNTAYTDGTTPSAPSVQVTATTANGTAPVVHAWSRADTGGGTDFLIDDPTIAAPTFSLASGVTNVPATTQQWRDTTTDAGSRIAQALVDVTLARIVTTLLNGFDGLLVEAYGTGTTGPTGGFASITFNRNGTWQAHIAITSNGSTAPQTVAASGNWHNAPTATIGDEYEIQFTPSPSGPGSVTNGASAYSALSSSRTMQWTYVRSSSGALTVTCPTAISLRKIGAPGVNTSGTVTLQVTGDNS